MKISNDYQTIEVHGRVLKAVTATNDCDNCYFQHRRECYYVPCASGNNSKLAESVIYIDATA